mmetsp:Transcript_7052/g.11810  ORF Transcript_7052/g.11810 Transcript_7052/m.11810 type:complete len:418 (+) Transcript_7052:68-1321(+)
MIRAPSSLRRVCNRRCGLPVRPSFFSTYNARINPDATIVHKSTNLKEKTPYSELLFGHTFSDHMLEVDWKKEEGWQAPVISEYKNFSMSPACVALHYALQCFEGMKAYKDKQGHVRLFRPDRNMARMNSSMARLSMPPLDEEGYLECIKQLLRVDESWVPDEHGYSLYIRPTAIGTSPFLGVHASEEVKVYTILSPVGPYYSSKSKPVSLLADEENVRAWPGGVGDVKVGGNYAPTIDVGAKAQEKGYSQVLWLYGDSHEITEVGAMNIFFVLKKTTAEDSPLELATAPLDRGDVLPGVTRDSILELCKTNADLREKLSGFSDTPMEVNERWVSMPELVQAEKEGRLVESFGAGTAAIVSPVCAIGYGGRDIQVPVGSASAAVAGRGHELSVAELVRNKILDIQYGVEEHPYSVLIN